MSTLLTVRVALRALGANKMRTALTTLGIVIGVGAVVALMSVGAGSQAQVTAQIQGLGTNLLFVRPGSTAVGGVQTGAGGAATLTLTDAQALAQLPTVADAAAELMGFGQVVGQGQNWNTRLLGITQSYLGVRNATMARGEWFAQDDLDSRTPVAVLGSTVAQRLFTEGDPVGQAVRITARGGVGGSFRVIGVMARRGSGPFGDQDDLIYLPITTMVVRLFSQRAVSGVPQVSTINVQVADQALIDQAVAEIGEVLRTRHRVDTDDFTIQSQQEFLEAFNQILGTFTLLLGAIAGISLVVGGIGIMNIMLVSVTERTHEIGIRKAVGARRRDILAQFIVESITVSVLGGMLGIAVGSAVASLLSRVQLPSATGGAATALQTLVTVDSIVLAFGVSVAVGLFFGIYPANRAATLNPIDALRSE
ncbi:MAG: ABC transporter permease [Chloroflexi bacterium]|nr:ABC transporter permease [Chloroflexota bacterium]